MKKVPVSAQTYGFKNWYLAKDAGERARYAARAGTTRSYLEVKLVAKRHLPREPLMIRMVEASDGELTLNDMLTFFYRRAKE